ncbi:hypothetical protein [Pseudoalteromonas sp. Xi13]|uniref:hypothetical protein n=1 Tax=Pseudoalteromonas sp. Xi13 TaxID=2490635 RepID=UPI000F75BE62|nr:hypothetical protein [Pseudoalteromonas sp. Xi13]AZN32001.1 hypothetical protein EJ103_04385 [Pseudoalteromonas sp. Xi13]
MRLLLTLLIITISGYAFAEEEAAELPPLNPKYKAEHAIALVNKGSGIYAFNLPSYKLPHDVQVVYRIKNPDVAFLDVVRNAELITLKPKPFNIQRLMRGEEITITADVYKGNYKKAGSLIYTNRTIEMSKQLYARQLKDLAKASQWQEYDMIDLGSTERIYIHKISQAPSFSHLIFVDLVNACMQKFRTSTLLPSQNELTYKFINCGTLKPLFYEAESLKK